MIKKATLFFSAAVIVISAAACTSDKSKVEDLVLNESRQSFQSDLEYIVNSKVQGKDSLRKRFVDKILENTSFEVQNLDVKDHQAHAEVLVKTVPGKVQFVLIDMISKLNPAREEAFNVADALTLVTQEMKLKPDSTTDQQWSFDLVKKDSWQIEKRSKH